jgi:hypothetical protein
MTKEQRAICAVFVGIAVFIFDLWAQLSKLGDDGPAALFMLGLLGILLAGGGLFIAVAKAAIAGFVVYGGIWFVQESFGLHPAAESGRPTSRKTMSKTVPAAPVQRAVDPAGVELALLRAELELSVGGAVEAACPVCLKQLSVFPVEGSRAVLIACPCDACRRECVPNAPR